MYIGKRLSYLRKRNGLNQQTVSKGIVSRSHYSNIESGKYIPQPDILELVALRFKIKKDYLLKYDSHDSELEILLEELKSSIQTNFNKAKSCLVIIEEEYPYIYSINQETYYILLKSCYLIKNKRIKEGKDLFYIRLLEYIDETEMNNLEGSFKEMFYYTHGLIDYFEKHYESSYSYFTKVLELTDNYLFKANIKFNLALSLFKINDVHKALHYSKETLAIYHNEKKWEDVAHVHNLIGLSYLGIENYTKSLKHFESALNLSEENHLDSLMPVIYHNIGLVWKCLKDYNKSFLFLEKSLELKKKLKNSNLSVTFRTILNVFIEKKEFILAEKLLAEARENCSDLDEKYHLMAIEGKISLYMGNTDKFEELLNECTCYFQNRASKHFVEYCITLAEYYENIRKYKLSTVYYKYAYKYLEEKSKGGI